MLSQVLLGTVFSSQLRKLSNSGCKDQFSEEVCSENAWAWACNTDPNVNGAGVKGFCDLTCSQRNLHSICSEGEANYPSLLQTITSGMTTNSSDNTPKGFCFGPYSVNKEYKCNEDTTEEACMFDPTIYDGVGDHQCEWEYLETLDDAGVCNGLSEYCIDGKYKAACEHRYYSSILKCKWVANADPKQGNCNSRDGSIGEDVCNKFKDEEGCLFLETAPGERLCKYTSDNPKGFCFGPYTESKDYKCNEDTTEKACMFDPTIYDGVGDHQCVWKDLETLDDAGVCDGPSVYCKDAIYKAACEYRYYSALDCKWLPN